MISSGGQLKWQPTEIRRFVRSVPSSTGVAVVISDAGEGYLKAIGNPEGEHVLACEWVATHLARWFGLPTFDFTLIEVMGRASHVAERIMDWIWPQKEFDFTNEAEGEP